MSSFLKIIIGILVSGVVASIILLGTANLSARESGLLSLILFVFSVLATWIVTHIYSEISHVKAINDVKQVHQDNLRTYALKAAEKVNNLSRQLNLLSVYLQEELDAQDYTSPPEELLGKEKQIAGAIQIINMLKSVNDTALSDWKGVIGEELEEQEEVREEKEEEIRALMEKLHSVLATEMASQHYRPENTDALRSEIESIRKELRLLVTDVVGTTPRTSRKFQLTRAIVENECPVCRAPLTYKQRAKPKGFKIVKCSSCNSKLVSRFDHEKGFTLEAARVVVEPSKCPKCQADVHVELGTLPGTIAFAQCPRCNERLRVARAADAIRTVIVPKPEAVGELSEDIIASVQDNLPPQPWPDGTSKQVGKKLGLPHSVVSGCIRELIRRGVFKVQIDGTLFVPEAPAGAERSSAANGQD
jgi:LSD1 subclass zinc finger protein